jgi:phosphohistidine phosphatase SixA
MKRKGRWTIVVAALIPVLIVTACSASSPPGSVTTVLLVRHAERDDGSLNEAGLQRAEQLAQVVLKAGVTAVYTTDTERTRRTARPLADALGLEPLIYRVGSSDEIREFAAKLQRDHRSQVVLVVGHNPTVPRTIAALGGNFADCSVGTAYDEFDDLCIVTIYGTGGVKVLNLQYGKLSP